MVKAKDQRILIWVGVAMSTVFTLAFLYLLEFWPLPKPTLGVDEVFELYARHPIQSRIGAVVMCLVSCFVLPWTVVTCLQMKRIEKGFPLWTLLAALAGTLGAWLFAFPPMLWGVAAFMTDSNPEFTFLMHRFGWLMFVAPANFFPMQMIPIAVIALSRDNTDPHTALPRWLGWLALWDGILGSSGIMSFVFHTGPFAWNGLFSFWMPLVFFMVWLTALIYCLLRAIGHQERVGAA
jgi:hypothetical protein